MAPLPARVEVLRGEGVESVHRVHVVATDGTGAVVAQAGDPDTWTFLRSAAKPFQALALVASGAADAFGLTDEELALVAGSHAGEPYHVALAEGLLARAGVDAGALRCGTHPPRSDAARAALAGARTTPLHHNCSGKHAGFLLLQRHFGQPPEAYLDPASSAQRVVLEAVARVAGLPPTEIGVAVDGCSAPTFAVPLRVGARLFARLALPGRGLAAADQEGLRRIAAAMARHPECVAGAGLFDTDLMLASEDRLVAKAGAEGVEAVGDLATGMGLCVKVEDGSARAVGPATIEALRQLSWLEGRAFEVLGDHWRPPVKNARGVAVGRVEPRFELTRTV